MISRQPAPTREEVIADRAAVIIAILCVVAGLVVVNLWP